MSLVKINWKPNATELRKFGVAMIVGFGLIGLIALWLLHKPATAKFCFIFGAVTGVIGLTGTKLALPIYWAWMGIAFVMGSIMSRVILTVFFYGVITPTGWVMRLKGRDKLGLKKPERDTYWHHFPHSFNKDRYERQF